MTRVSWQHLYSSPKWRRRSKYQRLIEPLCRMCLERGLARPAFAADHVRPHRGDANEFFLGPLQSLCRECHDRVKRFQENRGYLPDVGVDSCPIDPNHPANRPHNPFVAPRPPRRDNRQAAMRTPGRSQSPPNRAEKPRTGKPKAAIDVTTLIG
jgi:5-methylcytosine-specific restriction enzyme A